MKPNYTPERGAFDSDFEPVEHTEMLLNVGQRYEAVGASILKCRSCGSTQFQVGSSSYFTAIRCFTCMYEVCIHEG